MCRYDPANPRKFCHANSSCIRASLRSFGIFGGLLVLHLLKPCKSYYSFRQMLVCHSDGNPEGCRSCVIHHEASIDSTSQCSCGHDDVGQCERISTGHLE
jgi:hypothetical protein